MRVSPKPKTAKPIGECNIRELKKMYRVLEAETASYNDQTQGIIRKQKSNIRSLADANRDLGYTLSIHRAVPRDVESRLLSRKELVAKQEAELIEEKHDEEVERGQAIDQQIDVVRQKLSDVRLKNITACSSSSLMNPVSCSPSVAKLVRILEHKLDTLVVKTNEVINSNSATREKLELLRIEGKTIDQLESKMSGQLGCLAKRIDTVIEETTANYKAKDKATYELDRLRTVADRERADFDKELGHINKLLEGDLKVHQFLTSKNSSPKRRSVMHHSPPVVPSVVEEAGKDDKLAILEDKFENLKLALGTSKMSDLINKYNLTELGNFSLFTRSRQMVSETKLIQETKTLVELEVNEIRSKFIQSDNSRLVAQETEIRLFQTQSDSLTKKIDRIKTCIESVLSLLQVPGTDEPTEDLAHIDRTLDPFLVGKSVHPVPMRRPLIQPPTSIAREVDDDFQPLTREEIQTQLAKEKKIKKSRAVSASTTRPPSSALTSVFK